MSIARSLERRLERLFEGSARRVFSGRIHPSELAERIAREADLARFEHITGPATANRYELALNPEDIEGNPEALQRALEIAFSDYAADAGLRLEGPASVSLDAEPTIHRGQFTCSHRIIPGVIEPWARLVGADTYPLRPNRALVGRSEDADVRLQPDDVSRRHAVIFRTHGEAWIGDLGSSNGTWLDGDRLSGEHVRLQRGAMVAFAGNSFRFLET